MRKFLTGISLIVLLSGCAESMALLAPASTAIGSGNIVQSTLTSAASYGVKKSTGKSPVEHVVKYLDKHNPENKKEVCVSFLESTSSEFCAVIKKRIAEIKSSVDKRSHIQNLNSD